MRASKLGKLLQLLREVKPDAKRVSVLWTISPPARTSRRCTAELRKAEGLLGLKLHIVDAKTGDEVSAALAEIDGERPDALLLTSGFAFNFNLASTVTQFAVKKRLPTITDFFWPRPIEPYKVYGPAVGELMRSAAVSIDKILKGANPGDLPIQQPAKFEMIMNLKTATAIGLTIPQELLLRADRVIE